MSGQPKAPLERSAQAEHDANPKRTRVGLPQTTLSSNDVDAPHLQPSRNSHRDLYPPAIKSLKLPTPHLGNPPPNDHPDPMDEPVSGCRQSAHAAASSSHSVPTTPEKLYDDEGIILEYIYFRALVDDIETRFEKHLNKPHATSFIPIVTEIVEDYLSTWGTNVFLSRGHRDYGDDWLRWIVSSHLVDMLWVDDLSVGKARSYKLQEDIKTENELRHYWRPLEAKFKWAKRVMMAGRMDDDQSDEDDENESGEDPDAVGGRDPDFLGF